MDDILPELYQLVFCHLPITERVMLALVCKKFYAWSRRQLPAKTDVPRCLLAERQFNRFVWWLRYVERYDNPPVEYTHDFARTAPPATIRQFLQTPGNPLTGAHLFESVIDRLVVDIILHRTSDRLVPMTLVEEAFDCLGYSYSLHDLANDCVLPNGEALSLMVLAKSGGRTDFHVHHVFAQREADSSSSD